MMNPNQINENTSKFDQKVFLKDTDFSSLSIIRKNIVDSYVIFLKKGEQFELIRSNGIEKDIIDSFAVDTSSMVYSLLRSTDIKLGQQEVLSVCKESIFFQRESTQKLRLEIEYWEKLALEFFYPVRYESHGLIGFVVFSTRGKSIGKGHEKRFKVAIEESVIESFKALYSITIEKDIFMYKGLFELQRELLSLKEEEKYLKVYYYFQDILNHKASIMYLFQDKYFSPVQFDKITFMKPLSKSVFSELGKVTMLKMSKDDFLYNEFGFGDVIILKLTHKAVFAYKVDSNSGMRDREFLTVLLDILGKFIDD